MKITSKIIVLLMSVLLPIGFVGCSDDDDDMPNSLGEEAPEFVLGQESVKVKIGPENKVIIDIKQGVQRIQYLLVIDELFCLL